MFFYGTNSSRLKNGRLSNVTCPNCDTQTSMDYSVFGKYTHIYWIPFFPYGKENILECNNCKKTFKLKELPQQIKSKFELEKYKGIPVLHFSGAVIIACIIGFIIYSTSKDNENEALFIQDPKLGDVYSIESSSKGHYSSMKVTEVTTDSVYVVYNDYEIDKRSQINRIDKPENYTSENDGFHKQDLLDLYKDKLIFEINRD